MPKIIDDHPMIIWFAGLVLCVLIDIACFSWTGEWVGLATPAFLVSSALTFIMVKLLG